MTPPDRLTLRDHFAVSALTGMLADGAWDASFRTVERAYEIADMMMEARQNG